MKKFLLGIAMLLAAGSSFAQTDFLSTEPAEFTIKAGEEKEVTVFINAEKRMKFDAINTVIQLPKGVEPVLLDTYEDWSDELEDFVEVPVYVTPLNQLTNKNVSIYSSYVPETESESGLNELEILEFSMPQVGFPGKDAVDHSTYFTESIFSFKVKASDKAYSGEPIKFIDTNLNIRTSGTPAYFDDLVVDMQYRVEATIGENGYATFSWPVPVDFTDFTGKARIATADALKDGFVAREAIAKVPANTGIILEGDAGSCLLSTLARGAEADAATNNILIGTADAPVVVDAAKKFYALAKNEKGVGFYVCEKGVEIPQYKAYYKADSSSGADAFLFEETTGINNVEAAAQNADVYTISGVKVEKAAQKGIYIVNGKKVVVK